MAYVNKQTNSPLKQTRTQNDACSMAYWVTIIIMMSSLYFEWNFEFGVVFNF